MNNKVIYLDKSDQVICWGDITTCKNYINQMYNISLDNLIFEDYSMDSKYSSFYEDYEVVNVRDTNIYLTLGQVKLLRNGCQEETRGIKFIEKEIESLIQRTEVFDQDIIGELHFMKQFMSKIYNIYAKYNMENLFENLDLDALHTAYQMERENKGLPIVFIK